MGEATGAIPKIDLPWYPPDFGLHRGAETYLQGLLTHCREVASPLPADIVLWKFGRCFSHAAIVIEWPLVIHAKTHVGVVREDVEAASGLAFIGENTKDRSKPRPRKFFSLW